jgi:hypothetical protein
MSKDKSRVYGEIGDPEEWLPQKPTINTEPFEETESGIYLPTPKGKEARTIIFFQGLGLQVEESQEEIVRLINDARKVGLEWVRFTDVQYATTVSVPMSAIDRMAWVGEAWVDMEAARENLRQIEMARKAQTSGLQIVQQPMGRSNGKPRR